MSPTELISRTDIRFDADKVAAAFESLPALPQLKNAVAVTSQPGVENPLHDGIGARPEDEMLYNVINAEFRGTYFEEILHGLPFPFGRTRIMWIPAQKCYPVHTDHSYRYHLALDTHDHAFILFPQAGRVYHVPADGYLYKMDAREPHTAVNCGPLTRAHMVIVTDQQ
jgi:hypothetical protein